MDYTAEPINGHTEAKPESCEIRLLIDNSQVGAVIGKGGANSKLIREDNSVFLSILKSDFRNVTERVMVIKGELTAVGKAISMVCSFINEAASLKNPGAGGEGSETSIKLLVHRSAVGAIIGKAGVVIKQTQQDTGCRIQISQEPLPNSTDKTVTITGPRMSVDQAVLIVLAQLAENPLRAGVKEFQYVPGSANHGLPLGLGGNLAGLGGAMGGALGGALGIANPVGAIGGVSGYGVPGGALGIGLGSGLGALPNQTSQYGQTAGLALYGSQQPLGSQSQFGVPSLGLSATTSTQKIAIPTVTAGCVIGKGGATIKDIRLQSGTTISIADPEPSTSAERVVTISGSAQGIQTAIYLIRHLVEHYQPSSPQPY